MSLPSVWIYDAAWGEDIAPLDINQCTVSDYFLGAIFHSPCSQITKLFVIFALLVFPASVLTKRVQSSL